MTLAKKWSPQSVEQHFPVEFRNTAHCLRPWAKSIAFGLVMLTATEGNTQKAGIDGVFAGNESVRLEVTVDVKHLPLNGWTPVRCELNNVSSQTLLVSDEQRMGGDLTLILRDEHGNELPARSSVDSMFSGRPLSWEEKLKFYWQPLLSHHFVGKRMEFYPGGYLNVKPGHRYKISARLISEPDPEISQDGLKLIFSYTPRVLRGEVESAPIWIAIDPLAAKRHGKGRSEAVNT